MVEEIRHNNQLLAYLYDGQIPASTTFLASNDSPQQAGYIVYSKDSTIPRHYHKPVERHLHTTTEVLLVLRGTCIADIYDDAQTLITSRNLQAGNVLIVLSGGHGFRVTEDLVLFEVKQGPYAGQNEKVRF